MNNAIATIAKTSRRLGSGSSGSTDTAGSADAVTDATGTATDLGSGETDANSWSVE